MSRPTREASSGFHTVRYWQEMHVAAIWPPPPLWEEKTPKELKEVDGWEDRYPRPLLVSFHIAAIDNPAVINPTG